MPYLAQPMRTPSTLRANSGEETARATWPPSGVPITTEVVPISWHAAGITPISNPHQQNPQTNPGGVLPVGWDGGELSGGGLKAWSAVWDRSHEAAG